MQFASVFGERGCYISKITPRDQSGITRRGHSAAIYCNGTSSLSQHRKSIPATSETCQTAQRRLLERPFSHRKKPSAGSLSAL
jgi:hypothetical protein